MLVVQLSLRERIIQSHMDLLDLYIISYQALNVQRTGCCYYCGARTGWIFSSNNRLLGIRHYRLRLFLFLAGAGVQQETN
jgi:hypothetical protein